MDSISRNMAIRLLKPERVDLRDSSLSSSSFHRTMMSWSLSPHVTQHHYSQTNIQHYITNITISSEKSCLNMLWLNIYHITVNNLTHCIFKTETITVVNTYNIKRRIYQQFAVSVWNGLPCKVRSSNTHLSSHLLNLISSSCPSDSVKSVFDKCTSTHFCLTFSLAR